MDTWKWIGIKGITVDPAQKEAVMNGEGQTIPIKVRSFLPTSCRIIGDLDKIFKYNCSIDPNDKKNRKFIWI